MLKLRDGTRTRTNSQMKVQDEINLHNQEKKMVSAKSNGSGATNLVGITSSTSFTWPTTFGENLLETYFYNAKFKN